MTDTARKSICPCVCFDRALLLHNTDYLENANYSCTNGFSFGTSADACDRESSEKDHDSFVLLSTSLFAFQLKFEERFSVETVGLYFPVIAHSSMSFSISIRIFLTIREKFS